MGNRSEQGDLALLARGTGTVFVGLAVRVVLLFAAELLAARHLGPGDYGLLTWGIAVLNIAATVTAFGLNTAARRFIPFFLARGDLESLRGTVLLITGLACAGGLLGLAALRIGASTISVHAFGDVREIPVLSILAVALPFWNLQRVFLGFAAGLKRPRIKVLVEDVLVPVGFLAVVIGALYFGYRERGIAVGYAAVYVISALVAGWFVFMRTDLGSTRHVAPRYRARELLTFSWPLIVTEVLGKATGTVDLLIIGMLVSSASVGIYRVASSLAITSSVVLMCFGFLYVPIASEHFAVGNRVAWAQLNKRVARWTMLASYPFSALLFFRPSQTLGLFYGPEFADAEPLLRVLAVAYFLHAMVGFTGSNLVVAGYTQLQLAAHGAAFSVMVVGNLIVTPIYGILGASYVTLVALVTANTANLVSTTVRLRLHPFSADYIRTLVALLAMAVAAHYGTKPFGPGDISAVVSYCFGLLLLALLLLRWPVLIDRADRKLITQLLRHRRTDE